MIPISEAQVGQALVLRDMMPGVARRSMNRVQIAAQLLLADRARSARAIPPTLRRDWHAATRIRWKSRRRVRHLPDAAMIDIMMHRWPDVEADAGHRLSAS
jgi:hypothetical protein